MTHTSGKKKATTKNAGCCVTEKTQSVNSSVVKMAEMLQLRALPWTAVIEN